MPKFNSIDPGYDGAKTLEDQEKAVREYLRHEPNVTYKIKIVVSFLQITSKCVMRNSVPTLQTHPNLTIVLHSMAFVLDVEWPPTFQSFLNAFSFINLDFIRKSRRLPSRLCF